MAQETLRTKIYTLGLAREEKAELESAGFTVCRDEPHLVKSLIAIANADMVLARTRILDNRDWIRIGYAIAGGASIVLIGDTNEMPMHMGDVYPTFADVAGDNFIKLGDTRWKKQKLIG